MTGFRNRQRVLAARRLLARFRVGWWIDRRWPLVSPLDAAIDRDISGPPPGISDWAPDPTASYPRDDLQRIAKVARRMGLVTTSAACPLCKDSRRVLHHGSGMYAELRNCPACRNGRKVADTTIRNAHGI